jgi:hypothetical protein
MGHDRLDSIHFFFWGGGFLKFFSSYYIQLCFICRPSDSTEPTDAGIEGPLQLVHGQSDALTTRLDLIRRFHTWFLLNSRTRFFLPMSCLWTAKKAGLVQCQH